MPTITKEQLAELEQDEAYMRAKNLPEDMINNYHIERLRGWGIDLGPGQGTAAKEGLSGTQKAALFAGPALGGFYGAQLSAGRNALPFLGGTGRALTQFGGEALGIAGGDVLGRAVAGVPQDPRGTAETALGGATVGSLLRGATQVGGAVGGVPESVLQGAAEPVKAGGVPLPVPNLQRVSRAGPHTVAEVKVGISPEMSLAERAAKAANKMKRTVSNFRRDKEALIRLADSRGVRIPVEPIKDSLRQHLVSDPGPVTAETGVLNRRINATIKLLDQQSASTGGTMTPGQIDRLIRQQFRPKAYTKSGKVTENFYAEPLASAERSASELLTAALPGDVAEMNAQISQRLEDADLAVRLYGDPDRGGVIAKITNAFKPGNEVSAKALNILKEQDPTIVDDAYNLYGRRAIAGDIRQIAGEPGYFGTVVRKPVELATRAAAPFQRFAGGAAGGAYEAFYGVMNEEKRRKEARKKALERTP